MTWIDRYGVDHPLLHLGVGMDEAVTRLRGGIVIVSSSWGEVPSMDREQALALDTVLGVFAQAGVTAVSPGSIVHRMRERGMRVGRPMDHGAALWAAPLMAASIGLYVPNLPNWSRDRAVARDAADMISRGRPVLTELAHPTISNRKWTG